MKLTRIKSTGLKGQTIDIQLDKQVLTILGRNRTGKTAVLDTVTVGLIGYHPKLGKRIADTLQLASGRMDITIEAGPGVNNTLSFWRDKGTAKGSNAMNPALATPPFLLDLRDFLGRTGLERTNYVMSQICVTVDDTAIDRAILEACEACQKVTVDMIIAIAVALAQERYNEGASGTEYLVTLLDTMGANLKLHDQNAKNLAGAIRTGASMDTATRHRAPDDIRADIERARAESQKLAQAIAKEQAAKAAAGQRAEVEREIQDLLTAEFGTQVSLVDLIEAAGIALKRAEEQAALKNPDAEKSHSEAMLNVARADTAIGFMRSTMAETKSKLKKVAGLKCCPSCGAKGKAFKDAVKETYEDAIAKAEDALATAISDMAPLRDKARVTEALAKDHKLRVDNERTLLADYDRMQNQIAAVKAKMELLDTLPKVTEPVAIPEDSWGSQLTKLDAELSAAIARQVETKRAAEVQLQCAAAEEMVKAYRAAIKAVKDYQQGLLEAGIDTMLAVANKLSLEFMPNPIQFKAGEFGMTQDGRWIGLSTFSGFETSVAFAGLSVALCQDTPVKLVMFDEVLIDAVNRKRLADVLVKLTKDGTLDNALMIDTSGDAYKDCPDVQFHLTGGE